MRTSLLYRATTGNLWFVGCRDVHNAALREAVMTMNVRNIGGVPPVISKFNGSPINGMKEPRLCRASSYAPVFGPIWHS
jgi:hypothetical protein